MECFQHSVACNHYIQDSDQLLFFSATYANLNSCSFHRFSVKNLQILAWIQPAFLAQFSNERTSSLIVTGAGKYHLGSRLVDRLRGSAAQPGRCHCAGVDTPW